MNVDKEVFVPTLEQLERRILNIDPYRNKLRKIQLRKIARGNGILRALELGNYGQAPMCSTGKSYFKRKIVNFDLKCAEDVAF